MSSFLERAVRALGAAVLGAGLVLAADMAHAQTNTYPGLGRAATPKEVAAWDIDVRPDFKGLPPGSGSVSTGETLWTGKCASCHGDFGDDNRVFTPLVGNTTAEDIASGRVASLKAGGSVRTTLSIFRTPMTGKCLRRRPGSGLRNFRAVCRRWRIL